MDLSDPADSSVNDGIDRELCSLEYVSVDYTVRSILDLGPRTLIAMLDIRVLIGNTSISSRQITAGHVLESQTYTDTVLPFGLRSALKFSS